MKTREIILAMLLSAATSAVGHAQSVGAPTSTGIPSSAPANSGSSDSEAVYDELDLRDTPLRDALTLIGEAAGEDVGLNLAASDEAAKTKVTIHLRHVTAYEAVQAICQTHGLFFNEKRDDEKSKRVKIITTVKEFQQGLTVFHEEKTQVFTLLYPNATELAAAVRNLYGERVRLTQGKEGLFNESDDISRRLDRFDLIDSRSTGLGTSAFNSGSSGSGSNSGSTGSSTGGGNSSSSSSGSGRSSSSSGSTGFGGAGFQNTVNQRDFTAQRPDELKDLTPDQLDRVAKLMRAEGAGVGVDAQKLAGLGTNTSTVYVSVLARNNQVIVRTSDAAVLEEINSLKEKIDVPTPQVLLEMKVLSVDLEDGFTSIFDMQFGDHHNSSGFSSGDILPPTVTLPSTSTPLTIGGSGAGAGSPFALNPTALIYQYVNDNFRLRMQMLQNRNKVTSLATPILLVANNEVSRVFIGQEYPIITNISSQTTAVQGVVTSAPNTSFTLQPVGTTLLVTPSINADRTVTLRLVQESSSVITGGASIPVVGPNGTVTNEPVDVVSSQTISGTLVAKDGLSLALGGLITESVTDQREEVPVLGQIPVLGVLFRRQATGRSRHEVIVVIRPYVLSTPSESEATGRRVTEANSLHPKTPDLYPPLGAPIGGMKTYLQHEVLRPNPPRNQLEKIFQFHSVLPYTF